MPCFGEGGVIFKRNHFWYIYYLYSILYFVPCMICCVFTLDMYKFEDCFCWILQPSLITDVFYCLYIYINVWMKDIIKIVVNCFSTFWYRVDKWLIKCLSNISVDQICVFFKIVLPIVWETVKWKYY